MSSFQSTPTAKIGWVGCAHNKAMHNKVKRWSGSWATFFKATTDASIRSAFCTVSACAWYSMCCLLFVSSSSVCTIRYSILTYFLRNIKINVEDNMKMIHALDFCSWHERFGSLKALGSTYQPLHWITVHVGFDIYPTKTTVETQLSNPLISF